MLGPATLGDMLTTAARPGRHVAVVDGNRRVRLSHFDEEVTVLAAALRQHGIGDGARVAMTLGGLDGLACFFAITHAGGTAVPVSGDLPAAALRRIVEIADVSALISATASEAPDVIGKRQCTSGPRTGTLRGPLVSARVTWETPSGSRGGQPPAAALAAIFCTTGTTGEPRTVLHTHRGLIASVQALEALHRSYFRGPAQEVASRLLRLARLYRSRLRLAVGRQAWCTPMPFHSIAGLRFMMQAVLTGQRLVVPPRFHPRHLIEMVAQERVNILALTPTMLEAILAVRSLPETDLSSLLAIGLGGAPASAGLIRRGEQVLRCPILNGYGSTETGGGILATRIGDGGDGSVGHPFPGTHVLVVDDAGQSVPTGTAGELICRTGSLMAGYGELPGEAAGRIPASPAPAGEWYRTGDLAMIDSSGAVHIVGRCRDLIIRGGMKIVPARIEKILLEDPAVGAAAVVGAQDPVAGERSVAFVVPAAGATPRVPDVLAHCRNRLSAHEVPDHMFVVARLPTAESGEVRKVELRLAAARVLSGNALAGEAPSR